MERAARLDIGLGVVGSDSATLLARDDWLPGLVVPIVGYPQCPSLSHQMGGQTTSGRRYDQLSGDGKLMRETR